MNQWLKRQSKDLWVKQARTLGYRSRAFAKLQQIQDKYQVIAPNMKVLDCGAAPGSWSQVLLEHIKKQGRVVAVDLLEMPTLEYVQFYQGDIEDDLTIDQLLQLNQQESFDLIVSDIAPNTSGIQQADQIRQLGIVENIIALLPILLKQDGHFVAKVFQGVGYEQTLKETRKLFKKLHIYKPPASRKESKEVYWIGMHYQHSTQS